jgi:hypothetical protein
VAATACRRRRRGAARAAAGEGRAGAAAAPSCRCGPLRTCAAWWSGACPPSKGCWRQASWRRRRRRVGTLGGAARGGLGGGSGGARRLGGRRAVVAEAPRCQRWLGLRAARAAAMRAAWAGWWGPPHSRPPRRCRWRALTVTCCGASSGTSSWPPCCSRASRAGARWRRSGLRSARPWEPWSALSRSTLLLLRPPPPSSPPPPPG